MATADYALLNGAQAAKLDRELAFDRAGLMDRLGARKAVSGARLSRPPTFKCLLFGAMITLLYVWPADFMAYVLAEGFSRVLFNGVLVVGFVLAASAAWIVTARELRYWDENWHTVDDFSAPPPPLDLGGGHL
jgi:hypothetical protein